MQFSNSGSIKTLLNTSYVSIIALVKLISIIN